MENEKDITRRHFIKNAAVATAATGAVFGAPAILQAKNPLDKIGVGVIGVGGRGLSLLNEAKKIPRVEIRAVNEIWDFRMNRAKENSDNPKVALYTHYQELLNDKNIDAVIIATPDHLHVPVALAAADAGKHIYCEKGLTTTLAQAKALRDKMKKTNLVFQLGHNGRSGSSTLRAKEIYESGALGKVTFVRVHHFRNGTEGEWRWHLDKDGNTPVDCTPQHVDWKQFIANAPDHPFNARRYLHWRCYWDYGTGIAGDLLSHGMDEVNWVMSLGIPHSCVTTGGIYYWDDDRDVPDHWNAVYDWPERQVCVTYNCEFNNAHFGGGAQYCGKDGTLDHVHGLKVYAEDVSDRYMDFYAKLRDKWGLKADESFGDKEIPPVYEESDDEDYLAVSGHMQNFIDGIRFGTPTRCNIDAAFEEAVTIIMSVEAYKREKKVIWDPVKEEIV